MAGAETLFYNYPDNPRRVTIKSSLEGPFVVLKNQFDITVAELSDFPRGMIRAIHRSGRGPEETLYVVGEYVQNGDVYHFSDFENAIRKAKEINKLADKFRAGKPIL
jgi:hypothetical protein